MAMTKKDYIIIANAIRLAIFIGTEGLKKRDQNDGIYRVMLSIADDLERENPRFDRAKFLEAAGLSLI